ncbi:MAG: hypothetical protein ACLSCF_00810 [Alistipes finegoldii]
MAVDTIRASKNRILEHLAVKEGQEVQLKELVLSRFEFLDQLGRAFYERNNTKARAGGHLQTSEKLLYEPCIQSRDQKELEEIVNTVNDNIIVKLRKQFPKFKPADIDLLCYIYAGFSAQIISVIIGDSVSNVYNRKSRLKARIAASDSAEKDFLFRKCSNTLIVK